MWLFMQSKSHRGLASLATVGQDLKAIIGGCFESARSGLFHQFKTVEELTEFKDSDAFEMFATSVILPDELLAQTELTDLLLDSSGAGIDVAVLESNLTALPLIRGTRSAAVR